MVKFSKFEAFKLGKAQMNAIAGGISVEEYCKQIQEMASFHNGETEERTWTEEQWDSWAYAFETYCMK